MMKGGRARHESQAEAHHRRGEDGCTEGRKNTEDTHHASIIIIIIILRPPPNQPLAIYPSIHPSTHPS